MIKSPVPFFSLINLFSSLVYTYRYLKSLPKGMQQVREVVYFIEREPSLNYYFAEVCLFVCLFLQCITSELNHHRV